MEALKKNIFTEFYWFYWEIRAKKSAEKSLGMGAVSSNFIPIYLNFSWILLNFVKFIEWKLSEKSVCDYKGTVVTLG